MPSTSNSIGSLQLPTLDLDTLNDRMRRIGRALGSNEGSNQNSAAGTVSQVVLTYPDTLGVKSGIAPLITLPAAKQFSELVIILEQLPIGGPVVVQFFADGAAWGPSVTATGQITTVDVSSYPAIAKDALLRLDVTSVPSSFPGAGMTFQLR